MDRSVNFFTRVFRVNMFMFSMSVKNKDYLILTLNHSFIY